MNKSTSLMLIIAIFVLTGGYFVITNRQDSFINESEPAITEITETPASGDTGDSDEKEQTGEILQDAEEDIDSESESDGTVTEQDDTNEHNEPAEAAAQQVREFSMIARQWDFEPETITVNEGDRIKLMVTSIDVDHGIAIPDFGVSAKLIPDDTVEVEFTADKTGTFSFFCNVFCGSGHGSMRGTLIVK